VRAFDREADARAVHRLVEDAFADIGNQPPRSYEFWSRIHLERADFDPDLWFLAVEEGELVGVNLAQSGPLGGYVAQLAVRRDRRGRGLGLALLRHGFGSCTGAGSARSTSTSTARTGPAPPACTSGPACASSTATTIGASASAEPGPTPVRGTGGYRRRGWLKRSRLPEGSRNAQSRTP
jgi:GNAT superfamily N-acetyltransferase